MRRVIVRILLVAIAVIVAGMGLVLVRALPHARAAYSAAQDLRRLRADIQGWPTPAQMARARDDIATLDDALTALERLAAPTYPLLRGLAPLPRVGPALAAMPDLFSGATRALHGGRLLVDALAPALPSQRPQRLQDILPPLLDQVAREDEQLAAAQAAFAQAADFLARVPASHLPGRAGDAVLLAQEVAPLGEKGVALLRLAPALMGQRGESVWLVVAQNNEELRPTGGFISALGEVRVRRGEVGEIAFADSYRYVSRKRQYPPAPPAMREHLKTEILVLRDANWWPDVPTSARVVAQFYKMETGTAVDGVIFVDLDAVRLLVDGLGGLALPGGIRVTSDTLLPYFYESWNSPTCTQDEACNWWRKRKGFLNVVAAALMDRIQRRPQSIPPLRFARRLVQALDEHHILIIPLTDARARQIVAQYGWDAAMRPGQGDYLRITDTNVGFNKANAKVRLSVEYQVDLTDPRAPEATLILTYRHTATRRVPRCYQIAYYGRRYQDMQDRCYWNYLRVDVPAGATLVERHGFRAGNVTVGVGDAGTTEFAGLVIVPPGEERTVYLRYALPPRVVTADGYRLRVEKQPGTREIPFVIRVQTSRGLITQNFRLTTDTEIRLTLPRSKVGQTAEGLSLGRANQRLRAQTGP